MQYMNKHLKPLYYIDSNVFFSVSIEEHKKYVRYFFSKLFDGHFIGVTSSIVWEEVNADHPKLADLPRRYYKRAQPNLRIAEVTDDALPLAKMYIESGIFIPEDFLSALNIAVACIYRCDAFISWDYRGIINRSCNNQMAGINKLLGKDSIELLTPAMI